MLSPIVAALACVIAPVSARAVDGNAAMFASASARATDGNATLVAPAMSQPLEVGPLSSAPIEPLATLPSEIVADPGLTLARTLMADDARARAPMSPVEIACDPIAVAAVPDCGALISHADDAFGSCRLLAPARGLVAIFARGGAHSTHQVAAGTIARAPELLVPDSHATPILWPAHLGLTPPLHAIALFAPPPTQPLPVEPRRLDRPPRL